MKTRQGFVSNSSSSSFCVLGIEIDRDTVDKIKSIPYNELKGTGVKTYCSISDEDQWVCVGIDVTTMKDDETPLLIKHRLAATLAKIGVNVNVSDVRFIEDGGYNG